MNTKVFLSVRETAFYFRPGAGRLDQAQQPGIAMRVERVGDARHPRRERIDLAPRPTASHDGHHRNDDDRNPPGDLGHGSPYGMQPYGGMGGYGGFPYGGMGGYGGYGGDCGSGSFGGCGHREFLRRRAGTGPSSRGREEAGQAEMTLTNPCQRGEQAGGGRTQRRVRPPPPRSSRRTPTRSNSASSCIRMRCNT